MVTATTTTHRAATKSRTHAASKQAVGLRSDDAVTLLKADHAKVKKLFKQFEKLEDPKQQQAIAEEICKELTVHTQVEEEIFYPAVRARIKDEDLMNEAVVEHMTAKDLIAQIQGMQPSDPMYAAKVTVLGEYIDHHVKEEHEEMFPKAQKAKVDLVALGARIKMRKQELMQPLAH